MHWIRWLLGLREFGCLDGDGAGLDLAVEARTMGWGMLGIPVSHSACAARYRVLRPRDLSEPDEQDGLQEHRRRHGKTASSPLLDT